MMEIIAIQICQAKMSAAALEYDIHVAVSPGGMQDGHSLPNGIRWVVERLVAWLSRYRASTSCTTLPR